MLTLSKKFVLREVKFSDDREAKVVLKKYPVTYSFKKTNDSEKSIFFSWLITIP